MGSLGSSRADNHLGVNTLGYGVYYNHPINERWMLSTGIRANKTGYHQEYSYSPIRPSISISPLSVISSLGPEYSADTRTTHSFVELPLTLRYCRKKDKISPFFEFGVSSNLYVTTKEKGTRNGEAINFTRRIEHEAFREVNFALILAFGAEYEVNEVFSLFSRPSFRIDFLSAFKSEYTRRYNFNVGLEMGVRTFLN